MRALEKSMNVGSPQQKASAMLMIIQKLIGDDVQAVSKLKQRLQSKSVRQSVSDVPVEESVNEADLKGTLAGRKEKLEKTQAYKMLQKAIEGKPATQQVDFVFAMLDSLPLDQTAKNRLRMKFRSEFK